MLIRDVEKLLKDARTDLNRNGRKLLAEIEQRLDQARSAASPRSGATKATAKRRTTKSTGAKRSTREGLDRQAFAGQALDREGLDGQALDEVDGGEAEVDGRSQRRGEAHDGQARAGQEARAGEADGHGEPLADRQAQLARP